MTTPNLQLTEVPSGVLQPSVPVNSALQWIDALLQCGVQDKDLTAPPTTTASDVGKCWIVGAAATGAWDGQDGSVALCTGADLWSFRTPSEGWIVYVRDEDKPYKYTGTVWEQLIPATEIPYGIACSDESTALATGSAKATFRMPFGFVLTEVRASVTTPPSGAALQVDINVEGVSILSTKLTIDDGEKTSVTAATPAVISSSSIADDAEVTVDIDQIGSTVAGAGLKVVLIGYQA